MPKSDAVAGAMLTTPLSVTAVALFRHAHVHTEP